MEGVASGDFAVTGGGHETRDTTLPPSLDWPFRKPTMWGTGALVRGIDLDMMSTLDAEECRRQVDGVSARANGLERKQTEPPLSGGPWVSVIAAEANGNAMVRT